MKHHGKNEQEIQPKCNSQDCHIDITTLSGDGARPPSPDCVVGDNIKKEQYINTGSDTSDDKSTNCNISSSTKDVLRIDLYLIITSNDTILVQKILESLDKSQLGVLAKVYEKVKINNVKLHKMVEVYVIAKLIDAEFHLDQHVKNIAKLDLTYIQARVNLILDLINNILRCSTDKENFQQEFYYKIQIIAKNIHVVKKLVKSTYNIVPWEEMEFILVMFVRVKLEENEINFIYEILLQRDRILIYLNEFAKKLKQITLIEQDINSKIPNVSRNSAVLGIISGSSELKLFYDHYKVLKDIYSLEKIAGHTETALRVNPHGVVNRLTILRALQMTGEYMKNSLESPHLSQNIVSFIVEFTFIRKGSTGLLKSIRNSISHLGSLTERLKYVQESKHSEYFQNVQIHLENIREGVLYYLYMYKHLVVKSNINSILDGLLPIATHHLSHISISEIKDENIKYSLHRRIFEYIKTSINMLEKEIITQNKDEIKLVEAIKFTIKRHEKMVEKAQKCYVSTLSSATELTQYMFRNNNGKISKPLIMRYADFEHYNFLTHRYLWIIKHQIREIIDKLDRNPPLNHYKMLQNLEKILNFIFNIGTVESKISFNLSHLSDSKSQQSPNERILSHSVEKEETLDQSNPVQISSEMSCVLDFMDFSLGLLKHVITEHKFLDINNFINHYDDLIRNQSLLSAVEILVLHVMECLQRLDTLADNNAFLDDPYPVLVGKVCRNHLAHDNAINYLNDLHISETILLLNAIKLVQLKDELKTGIIIGSIKFNDITTLLMQYEVNLARVSIKRALFEAIKEGDIIKVKDCIIKGVDYEARDINGRTLLHQAAANGRLNIIKYFKKSLDLNVCDNNYVRPLHAAASSGHLEVVEYFLNNAKIDVNVSSKNGKTALHYAVLGGHKQVVELLLEKKADATLKDSNHFQPIHLAALTGEADIFKIFVYNNKSTIEVSRSNDELAIHYASFNGHIDVAEIIFEINKNKNLNARTSKGFTPLILAANNNQQHFVNYLISCDVDLNQADIKNKTALHHSTMRGHEQISNILISQGATTHTFDNLGLTPLHWAVLCGNENIVTALIEKGSSVNSISVDECHDGWAPLHCSAINGKENICKRLIKAGADISSRTKQGWTALHLAAQSGNVSVTDILSDYNSLIHCQDSHGYSPLHMSSCMGYEQITRILIAKGSNVNLKTNFELTPLHYSVLFGKYTIAKLLLEAGSEINATGKNNITPLHLSIWERDETLTKTLHENGALINLTDNEGMTLLHHSATIDNKLLIKYLIENGAIIDAKDNIGRCALHHSALNDQESISFYLINKGLSVNSRNNEGWSPLHASAYKGYVGVTKLLIRKGADINLQDKYGRTPLHYSVINKELMVTKLLIDNGARCDLIDNDGNTALLSSNNEEITMLLIMFHSNVNAVNFQGVSPLHNSVMDEHYYATQFLIEKGAYVNGTEIRQLTPLHFAALTGNIKITKLLIENGADVNMTDVAGMNPLHYSAKYGRTEVTGILIAENSHTINSYDHKGMTPLHTCCLKGQSDSKLYKDWENNSIEENSYPISNSTSHVDTLQLLIDKGADINTRDSKGWTPLHLCGAYGNQQEAELLLQNGATVNLHEYDLGMTPLQCSVLNGQDDLVRLLLDENGGINSVDNENMSPLHYSVLNGQCNITKLLLEKGIRNNTIDSQGNSPIYYSVMLKNEEIVKLLIEYGVSINDKGNEGNSLLHLTACNGDEKLFRILITNGSFIDETNIFGNTPLHLSISKGNENVATLLLELGANVNKSDTVGLSPLHYSVLSQLDTITKLLIEKNANINSKNIDGHTPFHLSIIKGNYNLVKLFLTAGLDVNLIDNDRTTGLHMSACLEQDDITQLLLDKGANVNLIDIDNGSALHCSALYGRVMNTQILLNHGSDVNLIAGSQGMSPLHYTAIYNHVHVAKLLLQYGADINILDIKGRTPLHWSCYYGCFQVTELFLIKGANDEIKDGDGKTPLQLCAIKGYTNICHLLLQHTNVRYLIDSYSIK